MKKFFNYAFIASLAVLILASCTKRDYYDNDIVNEAGIVDFVPSYYSPYFIVYLQSDATYAIVKSMDGPKFWPVRNERLYGNFNYTGKVTLRNTNAGFDMYVSIIAFRNNFEIAKEDMYAFEDEDGFGPSASNKNNQLSIGKERIRIK